MLLLLLLDAAFSSPAKFAMNRLTSRRWIVLRLLVLLRVLSVSSFLPSSCAIMLANFYVVNFVFFFSFSTVSSCRGSRWIRAVVIKVPGDVWRRSSLWIGRWICYFTQSLIIWKVLTLIASGRLFPREWDNEKYEARASEDLGWFLLFFFSLFCSLYEGRDVALIILETFNVVSSLERNIRRSELTSSSLLVCFFFFFSR